MFTASEPDFYSLVTNITSIAGLKINLLLPAHCSQGIFVVFSRAKCQFGWILILLALYTIDNIG
jgi:hypothetical protein